MNETKVVFKNKAEAEAFIVQRYVESPAQFSFLLEEETQNRYFKSLLMDKGSVISDRQMRTVKSELYRQITQDFGFRVVRDEHLAYYLFDQREEKLFKKLSKYLRIMSGIPDYFFDEGFSAPLNEYMAETDNLELVNLKENLHFCVQLYKNLIEGKIISASTTEVLIDYLKFDETDKILIFESYFKRLPEVLKENLSKTDLTLISFQGELVWRDQLELFEVTKNKEKLLMINFDNPLEEVRFLLNELRKDPDGTVILYPPQKGYENLFNLYQREFFEDVLIQKKIKKNPLLLKSLDSLIYETGEADSFTFFELISNEPEFMKKKKKSLNKIDFNEKIQENKGLMVFGEVIDFLNQKNDLSEELDLISELQLSLPQGLKLPAKEWSELLRCSIPSISKNVKLDSKLNIRRVDQSLNGSFSKVYVCGWGEYFFKPKISSVLSQKTLGLLEKDLGFKAWSIENSVARKLFLDEVFKDESVEIYLSSPRLDHMGKIVDPGVFSHLLQREKSLEVLIPERVFRDQFLLDEKDLIQSEEYGISASSLSLYDECPFKFYMYKVLGIVQDIPDDYFLDPLKEGSLIHELLEKYINLPITESEFLEKVRILSESEDGEYNKFRNPYIERISKRVWRILSEERAFLNESNTKIDSIEKPFSFYSSLENRTFSSTEHSKFQVRGKIDRIDKDPDGDILIYDYKRGASGISMFKNYKGQELKPQLFLYCLAAEEGFLGDFNDLVGFQYINITEQKRSGGFVNKELSNKKIVKESSSQALIEKDVYEEKLKLFLEKFWLVLEKIDLGEFAPKPRSHEICQKCEWKVACRKSETFL